MWNKMYIFIFHFLNIYLLTFTSPKIKKVLPLDTSLRGVGASVTFSIRDSTKKSTYVHKKIQKKYNFS